MGIRYSSRGTVQKKDKSIKSILHMIMWLPVGKRTASTALIVHELSRKRKRESEESRF